MSAWPQLTAIACDLARERLYDESAPDRVKERAVEARKQLRRLAEGKDRLVDANGTPAQSLTRGSAAGSGQVFSRDALRGF